MKSNWLVTPYFFDQYDQSLSKAGPDDVLINKIDAIADRSPSSLKNIHLPISKFVKNAIGNNSLPVSIAGDCVCSIPVMAGLQQSGLSPILVWLDAHADLNTPETSPTQFLGGMPLAIMVGRGNLEIADNVNLTSVSEEDVWLVGARDIDPLEKNALDLSNINRIDIEQLPNIKLKRPVHLHLDIDVVDAAEVPANNYPVPNGPTAAQTIEFTTQFIEKNNVVAISFSGWNGQLDTDGKTCKVSGKILAALVSAVEAKQAVV